MRYQPIAQHLRPASLSDTGTHAGIQVSVRFD